MVPVPLPGVGPKAARDALDAARLQVANIRTGGGQPVDRLNAYQRWSTDTEAVLRGVLRPADVERLLTTRRYWALHTLDIAAHGHPNGLVNLELDARESALARAVADLDSVIARRQAHLGSLLVADTNVFLHHPQRFDEIDWSSAVSVAPQGHHLLIPLVVVEELDAAKTRPSGKKVARDGDEDVPTRARATISVLEDVFGDPTWIALIRKGPPEVRAELLIDAPEHVRLASADAEIIDRASAAQDLFGAPVTLVTYDTAMRFRARAAGLAAVKPPKP